MQAPWHCVPKHEGSGFELISKPLQLKGSRVVKVTSFSLFSLGTLLHLFSAGDEAAIATLRSALRLITAEDTRGLSPRYEVQYRVALQRWWQVPMCPVISDKASKTQWRCRVGTGISNDCYWAGVCFFLCVAMRGRSIPAGCDWLSDVLPENAGQVFKKEIWDRGCLTQRGTLKSNEMTLI